MQDESTDVGVTRELARGGIVTLGAFHHHDRPHTDPTEERFDVDTVIFTTRGRWSLHGPRGRVEADTGVVVTARSGDPFRAEHLEEVPTDETMEVTFADIDPLPGTAGSTAAAFLRHGVPRSSAIRHLQAALWNEARERGPAHELKLDLLALQLLVELARANLGASVGEERLPAFARDGVDAARRHIDEHFMERITLEKLSAVALVSPYHLARAFRAELGTSPRQYLLRTRAERAAVLLAETALSVTQVAERVGFASPAHFSRTFVRRTGLSPSEYRRRLGRPR
jgi:AraC-like DNA-binding protein